ncbi:hypothetical protein XENORESO_020320, partial [Xenotaenia resolanae]
KRRGMDIQQMKTFVSEELKGLKQEHRLLSLHISASESIMKKKTKQDFQELLKTEHFLQVQSCANRNKQDPKAVMALIVLFCFVDTGFHGSMKEDMGSSLLNKSIVII